MTGAECGVCRRCVASGSESSRRRRSSVIPSAARDPFGVTVQLRKGSLVAALLGMTGGECGVGKENPSPKRGGRRRLRGRRPVLRWRVSLSNLIYGAEWPIVSRSILSPRTALMTGGSRGIGRAVADLLARAGARVAVNYVRDEAAANGAVREIRAAGGEAMALAGDVSKPDEARQLVRDVVAAWERLDILVNNAGIWEEDRGGRRPSRRLGPHVRRSTSAAPSSSRTRPIPHLEKTRGTIVFVSSTAGQRGEARALRVRGLEGRDDLVHEVARRGARAAGHPRQLRRARVGRHRHVGGVPRRSGRARPRSSGSSRSAGSPRPRTSRARCSSSCRTSRGTSRARSSTSTAGACWRAEAPRAPWRSSTAAISVSSASACSRSPPARSSRARSSTGRFPRRRSSSRSIATRRASWRRSFLAGRGRSIGGRALRGRVRRRRDGRRSISSASSVSRGPARSTGAGQGVAVADAVVPLGRPGRGAAGRGVAARGPRSGSGRCPEGGRPGAAADRGGGPREGPRVSGVARAPRGRAVARRGDAGRAAPPLRLEVRGREEGRALRRARPSARDRSCRATGVTAYSEFVHVPEQWTRDYERLRSKNEAAGESRDRSGLFSTLIAMLAVLVRKIVLKDVRWTLVGGVRRHRLRCSRCCRAQRAAVDALRYDTASPLSAYMTNRVLLGVLAASRPAPASPSSSPPPSRSTASASRGSCRWLGRLLRPRDPDARRSSGASSSATRWSPSSWPTRRSSTSSRLASARGPRRTCRTATC